MVTRAPDRPRGFSIRSRVDLPHRDLGPAQVGRLRVGDDSSHLKSGAVRLTALLGFWTRWPTRSIHCRAVEKGADTGTGCLSTGRYKWALLLSRTGSHNAVVSSKGKDCT